MATEVAPGVLRVVACNPSKMTYHGTNTYLLPGADGFTLIDPGPAGDARHIDALLDLTRARVSLILITHGHADHFGALEALRSRLDAPVAAYHTPLSVQIAPDILLDHGDRVGNLQALHTPGHAPDHLCFARNDGLVFTGDHVMSWSSSIVSPPNGNMADYVASLQLLIDWNDPLHLPGHGPPLHDPRAYVGELLRRRTAREEEILQALRRGPASTDVLRRALYSQTDPVLQAAAERNVLAHLAKLQSEGKVTEDDEEWFALA